MNHVFDQLHDWFIGAIDGEECASIEHHLESCSECQKALENYLLLLPEVEEIQTSENLLKLATPFARFAQFADEIAALADVNFESAKTWLSNIDGDEVWRQSELQTMRLYDIDGGPAVENAILGFISLAAGSGFPGHIHLGIEKMFVLQGTLIDEDGSTYGAGSLVAHPVGTQHSFSAGDLVPLIYLTVNQVGVEIGGKFIGPDSDDL